MTLRDEFLAELEAYLAGAGIRPTTFGRQVMGDPSFVAALKKGRCPTVRTIEFVRNHIARAPKDPA